MIRLITVPAAVLGAWALIAAALIGACALVVSAAILPVGLVGRIAGVW